MTIKNQTVLVTGANRGIGEALAFAFAQRSAHLLLGMRKENPELCAAMVQKGASSCRSLVLDLGSRTAIEQAVQTLNREQIHVDILVNNAGQLTGGLLEEQDVGDIYSMFQVNLVGLIHLTHQLLPGMVKRGKGKIVNNASVSGVMHLPCASTYTAAKTGVVAFTESLRQELLGTGVSTLVMYTPGVKTRMFDAIDDKYGKNLDLAPDSIPAEQWAEATLQAIEADRDALYPAGLSHLGLFVAHHFPKFFAKGVAKKFRRNA